MELDNCCCVSFFLFVGSFSGVNIKFFKYRIVGLQKMVLKIRNKILVIIGKKKDLSVINLFLL